MEKIQIAAARIVTGTNTYASKQLLYHETGWERLSTRRQNQRLFLLFKIVNGLAPPHLINLLDTYLNVNQMYDFRSTNIPIPRARTETYRCFFFLSAIRSWNCLDPLVRNANTIKDFKKKLKKSRINNPYYLMGSRCINSILASMRMHCCQLKSDIFRNNKSNNRFCSCGDEETVFHFFFECRNYTNARDILINKTVHITNITIMKILNGDEHLSTHDNTKIHEAVSKFIVSSKRFTIF